MWFPLTTIQILPGQSLPVATTVHQWEAILAGLYVLIVHMYFAHFRPEVFPYDPMMTDGRISEHHFKEEHPKEYEEVTGKSASHHEEESTDWQIVEDRGTVPADSAPKSKTAAKEMATKEEAAKTEEKAPPKKKSTKSSAKSAEEANEARRKALSSE